MARWNINNVRDFVESKSDCRLLSKEYINIKTKMLFRCKCGNEFKTSLDEFKNMNKRQCNECGYNITKNKNTLDYRYVKNFIEIESLSGCTLLSSSYKNAHQKLKIKCKCGNEFETNFNNFKGNDKRQCNECGLEILSETFRLSYEEVKNFIENESQSRCKLLSKKYKNNNTKLKILCFCGSEFQTSFTEFKDSNKRQCSRCGNAESKGEEQIRLFLNKQNITCIPQYSFDNCRNINPLPFDFYLPEHNILIEYDGEQHYEPIKYFGGQEQFEYTQQNDNIKNQYCKENNIPLLRIPYWDFDKIEEILFKKLAELEVSVA